MRAGFPIRRLPACPLKARPSARWLTGLWRWKAERLYLLAPIVRGRKGEYKRDFAELQKRGFQRVKVDGSYYEITEVPALDKKLKHDIDVVVDRWSLRTTSATALPTV